MNLKKTPKTAEYSWFNATLLSNAYKLATEPVLWNSWHVERLFLHLQDLNWRKMGQYCWLHQPLAVLTTDESLSQHTGQWRLMTTVSRWGTGQWGALCWGRRWCWFSTWWCFFRPHRRSTGRTGPTSGAVTRFGAVGTGAATRTWCWAPSGTRTRTGWAIRTRPSSGFFPGRLNQFDFPSIDLLPRQLLHGIF